MELSKKKKFEKSNGEMTTNKILYAEDLMSFAIQAQNYGLLGTCIVFRNLLFLVIFCFICLKG